MALDQIGEDISKIQSVFITHEHSDHIAGIKVIAKRYSPQFFMTEGTFKELCSRVDLPDNFRYSIINPENPVVLGDLVIKCFPLTHDAAQPVCFKITHSQTARSIGIITDQGCYCPELTSKFAPCSLMVVEANHDPQLVMVGPYPPFTKQRILSEFGHMSNEQSGQTIAQLLEYGNLKHVLLGHLSGTNNFTQLAYETVKDITVSAGFTPGENFSLDVLPKGNISKVYYLKEEK